MDRKKKERKRGGRERESKVKRENDSEMSERRPEQNKTNEKRNKKQKTAIFSHRSQGNSTSSRSRVTCQVDNATIVMKSTEPSDR
jgi:hypothetical protein